MTCSPPLIEAYMDEELGAAEAAAVEEHLAGCADCAGKYARLREQQAAIRGSAPRFEAPAGLERSIRQALGQQRGQGRALSWRAMAMAASLLLAVSLGWNFVQLQTRAPRAQLLAEEILSSHVRSLMGTHLLDVVSTDQHTVKPWFNGKLDFSPEVKDVATEGFPLIGGRIDYLDGRAVAALVYQRRKHVVNLFTWPGEGGRGVEHVSRNGYNELYWREGGMNWCAVSDIGAGELEQFRQLLSR